MLSAGFLLVSVRAWALSSQSLWYMCLLFTAKKWMYLKQFVGTYENLICCKEYKFLLYLYSVNLLVH